MPGKREARQEPWGRQEPPPAARGGAQHHRVLLDNGHIRALVGDSRVTPHPDLVHPRFYALSCDRSRGDVTVSWVTRGLGAAQTGRQGAQTDTPSSLPHTRGLPEQSFGR